MSKSTPVPTANTFAEAFPNSTKVFDETVRRHAARARPVARAVREVTLGGGEPPVRLYDTSGPQGHDPRAGSAEAARIVDRAPPSGCEGRKAGDAAALRAQGRDHAGDGVHRHARRPAGGFRARRSGARPRHHSRQHQSPRARADDHRPQLPGEDQRQHRQLRRLLVDRRGSREAALVDAVGRRHGDGSVDRQEHPRDARVDPAQLAGADRHRADLPGAREGRRPSGRSDVGDLSRHARSSRRSRASTTSRCTPACCCATSR